VQQIANSASLEPLREQSNVGTRTFSFIFETLIMQNLLGSLEAVPGLAESWKRIDERTVELALRQGVKFHNGDEMAADDVVFTFGRDTCSARLRRGVEQTLFTSVLVRDSMDGKKLPPEVGRRQASVPGTGEGRGDRQIHGALTNRTPTSTLEGRLGSSAATIGSRRAFETPRAGSTGRAASPVATGPTRYASSRSTSR